MIFINNIFLVNKIIFNNFYYIYNLILKNKYNNIFITINNNNNYKFIWSKKVEQHDFDFCINYITVKNNYINYSIKNLPIDSLNDIIILKKKSSLIKKVDNYELLILNKSNNNINNYNKYFFKNKNNFNNLYNNFKNIDFFKNLKRFITLNRKLLKKDFNIKKNKIFSFNKFIKNICNFDKFNFFFNSEFSLINILLKINFFFSENDIIWFVNNKLITVNGVFIKNEKFLLKTNDVINIVITNNYYYLYREKLDKILMNSYKIKFKLWSIQKNRLNNTNNKENYPKYINNYKYFNLSIPLYIELDYMTMSCIILNYNLINKNLNYFNFKFLNLYVNRLYNWKYII